MSQFAGLSTSQRPLSGIMSTLGRGVMHFTTILAAGGAGSWGGRPASLGDRVDETAARTKGPRIPLLAVGPGPQAVRRTGSCPHACAAHLGRTGARVGAENASDLAGSSAPLQPFARG